MSLCKQKIKETKDRELKTEHRELKLCYSDVTIKKKSIGGIVLRVKQETKTTKFKLGGQQKTQLKLWSFCIIPMILTFVFSYIPMVGIIIAFKDYRYDKGMFGSDWVGINNFKFFFESNEFFRITWNTLYMNILFIAVGIACAVIVAVLLFELKSRAKVKTFHTLLITPHFISWVIAAYMVYAFLNPEYGAVNNLLERWGMEKIQFYSIPEIWPGILLLVFVWKTVGMDSVLYYATLMGLDESLFEAAYLDGANEWQKARYITMPSLIPIITLLTIIKVGGIFRADFGLFYQIPRNVGALYETTDVIDTYVFRNLRTLGNVGMSSAVGLLQSVVGFVLILVTNWASKKIDPDGGLF